MKVKLQSNSKLRLVKAVKDMLHLSLKEAYDLVDEQKNANDGLCVTIDSEMTKEQIDAIADDCEVVYILIDEDRCPTHDQDTIDMLTQDDGLKDIVDFAKKIENAGVYLIPTEMGIQIVIVVHIPNEQLLVSQLKGIFKDAHFDVGTKEIENGKGMRLLFSKMFPNGAVSLDDINELAENAKNILNAYWIHRDFRELGKIVDNMVKEAFEKIGW